MQAGVERRKAARINYEAPLEYTSFGVIVHGPPDRQMEGRTVDLSQDGGGLGFVTAHAMFTGRKIQFAGAASGEVRWVNAVAQGYRVGAAVRGALSGRR